MLPVDTHKGVGQVCAFARPRWRLVADCGCAKTASRARGSKAEARGTQGRIRVAKGARGVRALEGHPGHAIAPAMEARVQRVKRDNRMPQLVKGCWKNTVGINNVRKKKYGKRKSG